MPCQRPKVKEQVTIGRYSVTMSQGKPFLLVSYGVTLWKTDTHELWVTSDTMIHGAKLTHMSCGYLRNCDTRWKADTQELWLPQTPWYTVKSWLTRAGDFSQGFTLIFIIGYIIGRLSLLKRDSFSSYAIKTHIFPLLTVKSICYYLNCYEKGNKKLSRRMKSSLSLLERETGLDTLVAKKTKLSFQEMHRKTDLYFHVTKKQGLFLMGHEGTQAGKRISRDNDAQLSPGHMASINSKCRWLGCCASQEHTALVRLLFQQGRPRWLGCAQVTNTWLLSGFCSGREGPSCWRTSQWGQEIMVQSRKCRKFQKCVDILWCFFFHTKVGSRSIVVHGCHLRMRLCGTDKILSG